MPLLFVIGTLCAIAVTILYRRKDSLEHKKPKVEIRTSNGFVDVETAEWEAREEYRRKQEASLQEHTDEFFGRPVGEGYAPPFPHKKEGYVPVEIEDKFPNMDQRYIFKWFIENFPKILSEASSFLRAHQSEEFSQEEVARAFEPARIEKIILSGFHPVKWTMVFKTDIGEGEAFRSLIQGEDQRMINAKLTM